VNIATYLNSRNEILRNIQLGLSKAYKLQENEIAQEVRKINLYVKNLLTSNDDVEGIIKKTEKINEEFVSKLTTLHPEITKNEKNIALMLRAGLSTKQIATLLDCNPKSVNMARYRMRTHLGMESDQNLTDYLKSL
jgi:DNA-binding CsgD family transcriptional regulator